MKPFVLGICVLVTACGEGAAKENPCPQGICISDPTAPGGVLPDGGRSPSGGPGSGGPNGGPSGACNSAWTCGAWAKDASGKYTRTCEDTNKCGSDAGKPATGPLDLPNLDLDYFKCKVQPILDRNCSMMGCHGTEVGRPFKVYSRARLRRKEMVPGAPTCPDSSRMRDLSVEGSATAMCLGWSKHTAGEWQENFDNSRSFMVGLSNPDDSELLAQVRYGGKAHTGVHFFQQTDADYQTIAAWLGGQKLGSTCNPSPN